MKINILTIFPEMFSALKFGIIGKAIKDSKIEINIINIRDFSKDKHKKTDDTPFGGGSGMLMTCQPIHDCFLNFDKERKTHRIYMSPKGKKFTQKDVKKYIEYEEISILCCNYEGVDERVIQLDIDEEISIGDYVLTGGELPAMVFINAISRYLDGVLGSKNSLDEESFSQGLLEYPQYTKPQIFEGLSVPSVLLSGNHQEIKKWRYEKSLEITKKRRPDLIKGDY